MAFRTQKISQMTPKGANLEATDLIEVSTIESGSYVTRSITGQEIIDAAVGNVDWGDIGGTLSNQTDLQNALNAKENTITAGTTSQYFRGDKTFQTLDKAAVGLGNVDNTSDANKPISTATQTALNAKQNTLSLTTTGDNGASTLVGSTLNVPNYTLSGLGGVPTSRTLTINGVTQDLSANRTFTISTGITIGSTAIASGVVGRVLFEGAGNVVQESSSLFWDNTNARLGIGTSTPTNPLDIRNADATMDMLRIQCTSVNGYSSIGFFNNAGVQSGGFGYGNASANALPDVIYFYSINKNILFNTNGGSNERMRIAQSSGNVLINTTTDAGFRLDVNGTARVSSTGGQTLIVQSSLDSSFTSIAEFNASALSTSRTGFVAIGRNAATNNQASLGFFYAGNGSNANRLDFGFFGTASRMSIFAGGNIGINTTTDAGFRLDVNGTARVSGPTGYSMVYDSSGVLNSYGAYNALKMYNSATLLCVNLGSEGPNGRLELGQNGSSYIRLNGGSSANDNYIKGATLIGANYSSANSSSVLECRSTTQGFLPPRMTTTQKNAIASPAAGLMVYDTTLNVISYYNGSMWI